MKLRLSFKLALKNLKAHRLMSTAFIISSSIMLALLQIYGNIEMSDYIKAKEGFAILSFYGLILITFFTFIFVLYSNSVLTKTRNKELALYGILGLEKKDIMRIILIENLIMMFFISAISSLLTFSVGKLMFLVAAKILRDMAMSINDYRYLAPVFWRALIFLAITFAIIFIYNLIKVKRILPIELLNRSKTAEKEPRSRWIITILGLMLLTLGYFIALTINGVIQSLGMFFVAALLVMLASYLLFTGFSIIFLKLLRKNKSHYYQEQNFIFISSMLYRMKSNAVGLASISILIAGLIITLATSLSIYQSIDNSVNSRMSREYQVTINQVSNSNADVATAQAEAESIVKSTLTADEQIKDAFFSPFLMAFAIKTEDELATLTKNDITNLAKSTCFLEVTTLDSYNSNYHKNITLAKDELLISYNSASLSLPEQFKIAGKVYKVKTTQDIVDSSLAIEAYSIVVPDFETLLEFSDYYMSRFNNTENTSDEKNNYISIDFNFDLENESADYYDKLAAAFVNTGSSAHSKEIVYQTALGLNGGALFLGIVIAILFLVGTTLIIYYKQISEGYQDRTRFLIMKKVGLANTTIKKTTEKQLLWLFFMPLIVAAIHAAFSSKIISQFLTLFGFRGYFNYVKNLLFVAAIIALVYFVIFKITSNIYYNMLKAPETN